MNFPTNGGGFYFVATPLDVEVTLPFEITPSIYFDRADVSQIEVIRDFLDKSEDKGIKLRRMFYEADWILNDDADPTKGRRAVPIAEHKFRYYIISFSGYGHDVNNLLKFMFILEPNISAFAHFYTTLPFGRGILIGRGGHHSANESFYFSFGVDRAVVFNIDITEKMKNLIELYHTLDSVKHEGIIRALEFFYTTTGFIGTKRMVVLAYFAVIEMLITHNPKDKEIGDSIMHQLTSKISLLSDRLSDKLDYSKFNKNVSSDKIWKFLYSYRSDIAHGNRIDFVDKLKSLNSEEESFKFLGSATRILLRHALKEPDLINGLKPI